MKNASEKPPGAGNFRRILPQILASSAKNVLLLDLGLCLAFPTIVIPALRGTIESADPTEVEPLYFTESQASWFGSIGYICQPVGSIISGWLSEYFGRKKSMILVNLPFIIAWILFHFAKSIEMMYAGAILIGFGIGFMEAPVITYVGEICEPSIRGIITSCSGVSISIGFFIVYLLGTAITWRTAALVCLSTPLIALIVIFFIPETPQWLLSKNRRADALKSVQWLRGWVPAKAVEEEFHELERFNDEASRCHSCQEENKRCDHPPPKLRHKLRNVVRKPTLMAFMIVITLFGTSQFCGIPSMRPFMVQIFKAYRMPIDPNWVTVAVGVVGLCANITCSVTIRFIGKRKLGLSSYFGAIICCLSLGTYATLIFPSNYNSFEMKESSEMMEKIQPHYFPLVAFMLLTFCTYVGITTVPWMILSEIFPLKTRSLATGITAALNYLLGFIAIKTYLNLDKGLSLSGAMWFYACTNFVGLVFLFYVLPETENLSLEEIERHFTQVGLRITDIHIKKQVPLDIKKNNNSKNVEETTL